MWLMETDTSATDRILYQLKTKGPETADHLARRLGVTAMAVRQHLYRLKKEGLAEYSEERRKVGRPVHVWRLTAAAAARFPDSHGELTLEMIGAVRAAFGESGLDRLLQERTRQQIKNYTERMRGAGASILARVQALAAIRREQGYMAECARQRDGSILLAENHCPICAATKICQGLCRDELTLFRAVLGNKARVERTDHILAGARRCAYVITPAR